MKIILSSAVSNANVRAVASGMLKANLLFEFYTSVASFPGSMLDFLGTIKPFADIHRRRFDPELQPYTRSWPWLELGRQISLKIGNNLLINNETGLFSIDSVCQNHDLNVSKKLKNAKSQGVTSVYSYEDMAQDTFNHAKDLGLNCIYDLPIAYWETGRKLLTEEYERLPRWRGTLNGAGIYASQKKLNRKKLELKNSDVVIVPSEFVRDSLPLWAREKKIIMATFGTPDIGVNLERKKDRRKPKNNHPLRVLFVGSMGQRKGLGDLFAAIRLLNRADIELVVMGSLLAPLNFYKSELSNFTYESGRPHSQVLDLMSSCDIFCLPSIVEGRALVMQEAMSQGLPLIITPNTGGKDLILEGKTGFLIPIRSPETIAEKLIWFLDNRSEIPEMGRMAQEHAAKYTWESYKLNLVKSLTDFLI